MNLNLKTSCILFLICMGCAQPNTQKVILPSEVASQHKELIFSSRKNLEALYVVFMLADYPLVSRQNSRYKQDAKKYFEKYTDHNAVKLTKKIWPTYFNFDFAVSWLWKYSELPEFKEKNNVLFDFNQGNSVSNDTLELFRNEFIRFYKESNFELFFNTQKPTLDLIQSTAKNNLEKKNIIEIIEGYYGINKNGKYEVTLSPLLHSGGFAIEMDSNKLFALIGPNNISDSLPIYDTEFLEYDLIIHEFGHCYLNSTVDRYKEELKAFQGFIYDSRKEAIASQGYSSFDSYLYELFVRAITVNIVKNNYGEQKAEEILEYEDAVGFDYVRNISSFLKEYERNRAKYSTLEEFMPRIIEKIKEDKQLSVKN